MEIGKCGLTEKAIRNPKPENSLAKTGGRRKEKNIQTICPRRKRSHRRVSVQNYFLS
jgi:hypothetical protein